MADSTFERSPRAMSPSADPARIGRRRDQRAGVDTRGDAGSVGVSRAGIRIAVRGLVVLGFAGTAWLLSSAVAHASSDDLTDARSATGPVTVLGAGLIGNPVGTPGGQARGGEADTARMPGTNVPARVIARSATMVPKRATAGRNTVSLAGVPGITAPLTDPSHRQAPPAAPTRPVRSVAAEATLTEATLTEATAAAGGEVSGGTGGGLGMRRTVDRRDADVLRLVVPDGGRPNPSGMHHVPQFPRPAPAPASPVTGTNVGAQGVGSVLNLEADPQPVQPASIASTAVVDHRTEAAAQVEVRRLFAESPTVSPD